MEKEKFIVVQQFCQYYDVEDTFIHLLNDNGLIRLSQEKGEDYIHHEEIYLIEKYIQFYYEMNINIAGIEAISHLLTRIENLQEEIKSLRCDLPL